VLSKGDRGLTKKLRAEKAYGAKRLVAEFRRKKLIYYFRETPASPHKIDTTGSADSKASIGRRRTACTVENVNHVEDHLKERLIEDWHRFDQNIIDRAVNQWHNRLRKCIRARGGQFEHLILTVGLFQLSLTVFEKS